MNIKFTFNSMTIIFFLSIHTYNAYITMTILKIFICFTNFSFSTGNKYIIFLSYNITINSLNKNHFYTIVSDTIIKKIIIMYKITYL